MASPNPASERGSCQLSYGWTIMAFPLRTNEVADRARLNSLRISGSARAGQRVSMTASLKSSNVPDYVPQAGIVPAACIQRYETGWIKQSSFDQLRGR